MIIDSKNPCGLKLDTETAKLAKITLFRGSFYKFEGVPHISHRKDPEIRGQRPKKPVVDQIWWWTERISPNRILTGVFLKFPSLKIILF